MSEDPTETEVEKIVTKFDSGRTLTAAELSFIREHLARSTDRATLRSLLYLCRELGDHGFAPFVESHLQSHDPSIAADALWVLCRLGEALQYKSLMMRAVDPGLPGDPTRESGRTALRGAGWYLRTNRDRDFAQLLIRWAPPENQDELLNLKPPPGMSNVKLALLYFTAGHAMGVALGEDPDAVFDDEALYNACVKRFLIERQDG